MLIREIMSKQFAYLQPEDTLREAVRIFHTTRLEGAPVVDDQMRVIGIFTKSRLFACLLDGRSLDESVAAYMATDVVTVPGWESFSKLQKEVRQIRVGQAVVTTEEGRAVGMLTKQNVISGLLTQTDFLSTELDSVKKLYHTLETVMELAYDGIVVVDENGLITMANRSLAEFLGVAVEELINRPVDKVMEHSHLETVAKTGVAEICDAITVHGRPAIISRLPIIKEGHVVGAVGKIVFQGLQELKEQARRLSALERQVAYYKEELHRTNGARYTFDSIVSSGAAMANLKKVAQQVARGNSSILIQGESGTGKELLAHAIHNAGPRRSGPFIKANCAAIPENLLESEFFGYADGAFTGAKKGGKPGKFELADGGTLFLDEVGDMSPALQAKLLRVLQDREFERVGGTQTIRTDVRIIAASNQDLLRMVAEGRFREDLYYRLNVISLYIPPLRERKEDILSLVHFFIQKYNKVFKTAVKGIEPDALQMLQAHDWPGNIRELENVIERAMNLDVREMIRAEHLPGEIPGAGDAGSAGGDGGATGFGASEHRPGWHTYRETVARVEYEMIAAALKEAGGNKTLAARQLGMSRSRFYEKLKQLG
ncbi:MAG: sigma 54-interacting transcriptional regulator [Firmicutes bacterium]|nr:sigma 54-interacting transcriptional regulator [Bacillota bacterium]